MDKLSTKDKAVVVLAIIAFGFFLGHCTIECIDGEAAQPNPTYIEQY